MVGGLVQLLELPAGGQLLVNEDGIGLGLPLNAEAMRRWPEWGNLRGPVVYLTGDARWLD